MELDIQEACVDHTMHIVNYFCDADNKYLRSMGADKDLMPSKPVWSTNINSELAKTYEDKQLYYLIWMVDGEAVGHSNINYINYGVDAKIHLHIWSEPHRKKGFALDFLRKSIPCYFKKFKLKRLICEPYAHNQAPVKTLESLGFKLKKIYKTTPGSICFQQSVRRYILDLESFCKNEYDRIIQSNFIHPEGLNKESTLTNAQSIVELIIDHLSDAQNKKVLPQSFSLDFKNPVLHEYPQEFTQIIKKLNWFLKQSMNANSPYYIGHMDSMATIYSSLGDFITSAINNNMFCLEMSPFLTHLEYQIVKEFSLLFGYDERASGLILGGGSLANLQALTVARNALLNDKTGELKDEKYAIVCSELAHISVTKSAMILGIGSNQVIKVKTDEKGHMIPSLLESTLKESKRLGNKVVAVVATAGSTVTGNIDPVEAIAEICQSYGVWLHVDAIWGGALILTEKYKDNLRGIHRANSITFNPQKWMMVAKTCSLVLFKDGDVLDAFFRVPKDYVKEQDDVTDLSEIGIVGTKRADVLKLWLSVQGMGLHGYEVYIDRTMEKVQYFYEKVQQKHYLRVAYPPETAMIAIRYQPDNCSKENCNLLNTELQSLLLSEKNTFVSLPKVDGDLWLRIILINPFITREILDDIIKYIEDFHQSKPVL